MFLETVRLALRSVRRNVLRSFLTLLGIVIGVAAVIAMITIGSGTTEKVKNDISKLGSNLLVVRAARPDRSGSTSFTPRQLDDKDVAGLVKGLDNVNAVSAASQKTVRVVYGAENVAAEVTGTDTEYFVARDWDVAEGRLFTESEVRGGTNVCVIGETVRQQFFGAGDPDGLSIRVNRMSCKVIGVLQTKGFSGFGQDQDNVVMMPMPPTSRLTPATAPSIPVLVVVALVIASAICVMSRTEKLSSPSGAMRRVSRMMVSMFCWTSDVDTPSRAAT